MLVMMTPASMIVDVRPKPMIVRMRMMVMIAMTLDRFITGREQQRLDDNRNDIGGLREFADIDIVELPQLQPVERDDRPLYV